MVKLTPELIDQAIQYINPVRERELLLRGKLFIVDQHSENLCCVGLNQCDFLN